MLSHSQRKTRSSAWRSETPRRHEGTFGVPLSLIEPPHQPHDREESHSVVDTELEKKEGDDNEKVTKENRSPFHKNLTDD